MTTRHAPRCTAVTQRQPALGEYGKGYQGFKNYPTWAAALWIDNDQWANEEMVRIATSGKDKWERLREYAELVDSMIAERPDTGLAADLINWARAEIDLSEIDLHHPASDFS
jgi:hypothetical protein